MVNCTIKAVGSGKAGKAGKALALPEFSSLRKNFYINVLVYILY